MDGCIYVIYVSQPLAMSWLMNLLISCAVWMYGLWIQWYDHIIAVKW